MSRKFVTPEHSTLRGSGMTVEDLISQLQDCDPDAIVLFCCDYGDHCHTQQALPVSEVSAIAPHEYISESAYSQSGLSLEEMDDQDDEDGDDKDAAELPVDAGQFVILK